MLDSDFFKELKMSKIIIENLYYISQILIPFIAIIAMVIGTKIINKNVINIENKFDDKLSKQNKKQIDEINLLSKRNNRQWLLHSLFHLEHYKNEDYDRIF